MSARLYLPHLQPKLLGSARVADPGRNVQLLTALNKSCEFGGGSSRGGSIEKVSPRIGTSPGGASSLRPVLQKSRLTDSTAPSVNLSNQRTLARNGFVPYKYKVSVNEIVSSANKTDNQFVLPGYHDKLPAPFTNKDKPKVLSMNRDQGPRDFISFY